MKALLLLVVLPLAAAWDDKIYVRSETFLPKLEKKVRKLRLEVKEANEEEAAAFAIVRRASSNFRLQKELLHKGVMNAKMVTELAEAKVVATFKASMLANSTEKKLQEEADAMGREVQRVTALRNQTAEASVLADEAATVSREQAFRRIFKEESKLAVTRKKRRNAAEEALCAARKAAKTAKIAEWFSRQIQGCQDRDLAEKATSVARNRATLAGNKAAKLADKVQDLNNELKHYKAFVEQAQTTYKEIPSPAQAAAARINARNYLSAITTVWNQKVVALNEAKEVANVKAHLLREVEDVQIELVNKAKEATQPFFARVKKAKEILDRTKQDFEEARFKEKREEKEIKRFWDAFQEKREAHLDRHKKLADEASEKIKAKCNEAKTFSQEGEVAMEGPLNTRAEFDKWVQEEWSRRKPELEDPNYKHSDGERARAELRHNQDVAGVGQRGKATSWDHQIGSRRFDDLLVDQGAVFELESGASTFQPVPGSPPIEFAATAPKDYLQ